MRDQSHSTLRDRQSVNQEMQTATAAGKFSGLLIAGLAPLSFVMFLIFAPDYVSVLFQTALGQALLVLAGLLELIGFFLIWKIVTIDY